MTYQDYLSQACALLALECSCTPEAFLQSENLLTLSRPRQGGRVYMPHRPFFHMVTFGGGAVITAAEPMQDFLREYIKNKQGHWLFELPNLLPIQHELEKHGYALTQTHHLFLPDREAPVTEDRPVKWYFGEELTQFRCDPRFPNAIEAMDVDLPAESPLKMAVCAYHGDQIIGIAGCAEDAPGWYQIGIDVLPEYRSQGLGKYLTALMKNAITRQGGIPYYITSTAGYHSWKIALACGFRPAWVEIGAERQPAP